MSNISFKLNSKDAVKKIHEFIAEIDRIGAEELNNYALDVELTISQDDSFGGNVLKNSVRHNFVSKLKVRTFTGLKHASYIESGTRPHIITARRARFLRFIQNGEVVFRKQVMHPGNRAYKFFSRAHNSCYESFIKRLNQRYINISRKFSS